MHKQNLIILAKYLLSGEWKKSGVDFDMDEFHQERECGSSGCAVGHATLIPELGYQAGQAFTKWSISVFDLTLNEWAWCFDTDWQQIDNTAEGAGRRILYLVQGGELPDGFSSTRLMNIDSQITRTGKLPKDARKYLALCQECELF